MKKLIVCIIILLSVNIVSAESVMSVLQQNVDGSNMKGALSGVCQLNDGNILYLGASSNYYWNIFNTTTLSWDNPTNFSTYNGQQIECAQIGDYIFIFWGNTGSGRALKSLRSDMVNWEEISLPINSTEGDTSMGGSGFWMNNTYYQPWGAVIDYVADTNGGVCEFQINTWKTVDNGTTWELGMNVYNGSHGISDPNIHYLDNGNLIAIYRNNNVPAEWAGTGNCGQTPLINVPWIQISYSYDYGETWTEPENFTTTAGNMGGNDEWDTRETIVNSFYNTNTSKLYIGWNTKTPTEPVKSDYTGKFISGDSSNISAWGNYITVRDGYSYYVDIAMINDTHYLIIDHLLNGNSVDTYQVIWNENSSTDIIHNTPIIIPTNSISRSSGGDSGGSDGGGASTSSEDFLNLDVKESYDKYIYKDIVTSYIFKNLPIININITGTTNSGEIKTTVELLKNTSSLINDSAPDIVYKNLNIWVGTSGFGTSKNIQSGTIIFKVDNEWLNENNINNIKLYKYNNTWTPLDTNLIQTNSDYTIYEAKTNTFSTSFAIVGAQKITKSSYSAKTYTPSTITPVITSTPTVEIINTVDDTVGNTVIIKIVMLVLALFSLIYIIKERLDNYK